ncbi:hypothetical protein X975_22117, partial [Stegodyphus mimosarum]
MTMDITTLNRKRGNIKGQLTRISNAITAAEKQTELDIAQLQAHLDTVVNIHEKFEVLKNDYYRILTDDEFEEAEALLSEVDEDIEKLEVSLKTSINKQKTVTNQNSDSPKNESYSVCNDQFKRALVKLPKIPLPNFSGKFEEWNLFKTQFNSLIKENPELYENEKLHYLRGALKGEAKSLETSDDNFSSLFKALEQRYENKRIIVDCHIKNILNTPSINHESAKELRIMLDNIKKNLRSLKILDFARDKLSNVLLLNIVLDKLDRETRKQYELTLKDNEVPDFDTFLEFLERRCQILNSISANIPSKFNSERSKSLLVKSNKSPKLCIACKLQPHALYHCDKFKQMKLSERVSLVKKHRLCYNCLSEFHLLSQCKSNSVCYICKKKSDHHTLLHAYSAPLTNSSAHGVHGVDITGTLELQEPNQQNINSSRSIDSHPPENARISFFSNGNNKSVLINTVIIYIRNSAGESVPLRAILDSASESSFMTTRAADALGLKKEKINVPISGLNDTPLNIKKKVSAYLSNESNDSHWEIDLLIVPNITNFTPSKRINVSNLYIPRKIKLADPLFFVPQKVDILLGAELFFSILRDDKIKLGENLFLQSSCFGYLVSGSISDNNLCYTPKHCFLAKNLETLNKTLTSFIPLLSVTEITEFSSET